MQVRNLISSNVDLDWISSGGRASGAEFANGQCHLVALAPTSLEVVFRVGDLDGMNAMLSITLLWYTCVPMRLEGRTSHHD